MNYYFRFNMNKFGLYIKQSDEMVLL